MTSTTSCDLTIYERRFLQQGYLHVVGVDEAGRGPLAGPVVAAAVLFASHPCNHAVMDSKQLSEKKRESLYEALIHDSNVRYGLGVVSPQEIDQINILKATHLAMKLAVQQIAEADFALIDGLPIKNLPIPHHAIVKGDSLSESIAAASIIAKVWRDRYMNELDQKWPCYQFASNKGYGTKAHMQALQQFGPCPEHRMTFAPIRDMLSPPPQQLSLSL